MQCGSVREVKVTVLPDGLVATVEFQDRVGDVEYLFSLFIDILFKESIPAALTKDKKRIHGQEVAVHLAWKSTLYVTNFPESADDPYMRNVFGKVRFIS